MKLEGCYEWSGNNRYGDNHRTLRLFPQAPDSYAFELVRITSAGPMGKAGSTVRGRVEKAGEGRFVLVGETEESWVSDDEPWSETRPSTARWDLVRRTMGKVEVAGETYTRAT